MKIEKMVMALEAMRRVNGQEKNSGYEVKVKVTIMTILSSTGYSPSVAMTAPCVDSLTTLLPPRLQCLQQEQER
jgi:hypothetical protein